MLKKIFIFTGKDLLLISIGSFFTGLALFFAESAFAFVLQMFFAAIGLAAEKSLDVPFVSRFESLAVYQIMMLLVLIIILRASFQWIQYFLQYKGCFDFIEKQRHRILTWAFGNVSPDPSRLISQFGDYVFNGGTALLHMQIGLSAASTALFMACALFYFLPLATLISLTTLFVLWFPIGFINKKIKEQGFRVNEDVKNINIRLFTGIKNLIFLRLYGLDEKEKNILVHGVSQTRHGYMIYYKLIGFAGALPQVLGILVVVSVVMLVQDESVSPGLLISYFYIFFRFLQSASVVVTAAGNFSFYLPSLVEVAKWWSVHSHDGVYNPVAGSKVLSSSKLKGSQLGIEAKNIEFSYTAESKKLFDDLSFKINPGSCFVIIGPSGAGKSTLLSLILGQLAPRKGDIYVLDGNYGSYPVHEVKTDYFQRIAYVGPDPFLITGSVRDNLTYGLPRVVSDGELLEVMKEVEGQFIFQMEDGLDHQLTYQGEGLSSGQKQRIALARALLRDPSILILDEATANLDSETESSLVNKLKSLKGKMTMLVVTHRQALLVLADQVLDLGKIK